jgi:hypothetical protein
MVAARSASAPDVRVASELGSLFLLPAQIGDPRWRVDAYVRMAPALHRLGVPLDRIRARVRADLAAATCPQPLRERLAAMLGDALDVAGADALSATVDALWSPSWAGASLRGVAAALMLDAADAAAQIAQLAAPGPRQALDALLRTGCVGDRFVGVVRAPGSEDPFAPSLPLLAALVDASRAGDAERLARRLGRAAMPELARLALRVSGVAAARARIRAIRQTSVRSRARLAVVAEAIARRDLWGAHAVATDIETRLARDHARLLLARAHVERDELVEAMTEIHAATDPRVDADRRLLVGEIGLVAVRRHEEGFPVHAAIVRAARPVPGWPHPEVRRDIVFAVLLTRFGRRTREQIVIDDVARTLREIRGDRDHRLAFLALAERAGIDLDNALVDLRCAARGLDAYAADRVAMRAARLADVPIAITHALAGAAPLDTDARSLDRAMFDEGVALSADGPRRRRVLIGAARHCLRDLAACSAGVVDTRLRTLVHLGGTLASDAIAAALDGPASRASGRALDALTDLESRQAAAVLVERYLELRDAGVDVDRAMRRIELAGGLARGFAAAFVRARKRPSARWLVGFVDVWRERTGALPGVEVLAGIARDDALPRDPLDYVTAVARARDELAGEHHVAIADRIARDRRALERLLIGAPARVDDNMPPWPVAKWSSLLERASKIRSTIAPRIAIRFARILGRSPEAEALVAGDLVRLGAKPVDDFDVAGESFRVQLLDKRRDLLTYLRFADVPARSCYRSDSAYYDPVDTIVAWKDPLTFCFRIERYHRPCGFVFGGFADVAGAPAVALNSLHVRPAHAAVRERIVRAVETMLCEPLGITRIAIANAFGGYGPLPANYASRTVELTLHRALHVGGEPVTDSFDDISFARNERCVVDWLYWRT